VEWKVASLGPEVYCLSWHGNTCFVKAKSMTQAKAYLWHDLGVDMARTQYSISRLTDNEAFEVEQQGLKITDITAQ